jgi:peptide-methionine (S)-S-oxide reductase
MKSFFAIAAIIFFTGCASSQNGEPALKIPAASASQPTANEAVAYFSEGCFWHTEIVFQSLVGVRDAISGYAGGTDANPDYEKVSDGETGHAETVKVYYDPSKISFETLVKAFFASHDPTQLNRQGNDAGTQYRSIAFYSSDKEKQIINDEIKRITDEKKYSKKIVTEVRPVTNFYNAEDYHQEYILHHPNNPYVQSVSIPDFQRFKKEFKGNFKS